MSSKLVLKPVRFPVLFGVDVDREQAEVILRSHADDEMTVRLNYAGIERGGQIESVVKSVTLNDLKLAELESEDSKIKAWVAEAVVTVTLWINEA